MPKGLRLQLFPGFGWGFAPGQQDCQTVDYLGNPSVRRVTFELVTSACRALDILLGRIWS